MWPNTLSDLGGPSDSCFRQDTGFFATGEKPLRYNLAGESENSLLIWEGV